MRARVGAAQRVTLLELLQARSRCKTEDRRFDEWVRTHKDGLEAGVRHYEALGEFRKADALRETIRRSPRW